MSVEFPRAELVGLLTEASEAVAARATVERRPVVVLGRDAWPLVPLVRRLGVPTQYFVFSRLQIGDPHTERQWLWECPPDALVVDTGYAGSIIDRIRDLDPTVVGALMSSANPAYPAVCKADRRGAIVGDLEHSPKLIRRVARMDRGRLRYSDGYDGTAAGAKEVLRWNETLCAELGLGREWARFTGMTPHARMGCPPAEVADRYAANLLARMDRGLPIEPSPHHKPQNKAGYWTPKTLVPAPKLTTLPNPVPPGMTLAEDDGVVYALFDHLLMIDWDVDDGSHANPRKQCLVDSAGEAWLRLKAFVEKNPQYAFDFYLTPGGARAFCVSHYFHPKDPEAVRILKVLGCDRLYRRLAQKKGVWACRVSPKVGRKGDYVARWAGHVTGPCSPHIPGLAALVTWHNTECAKFGGGVVPAMAASKMPF